MSIFENFFRKQQEAPEQGGGGQPASPEAAPEKKEQFEDCVNTSDFRIKLAQGKFGQCEAWLKKVEDNRKDYPQYNDSWFEDRRRDIKVYSQLAQEGKLENFELRSKESAQAELMGKFGFCDTAGFRKAISEGRQEEAQAWLDYILADIRRFPQYWMNERWENDRRKDLSV